jgi:hypothetical protein
MVGISTSAQVRVFTNRMVGLKNISRLSWRSAPVRVLTDRIVGIKKLKNN